MARINVGTNKRYISAIPRYAETLGVFMIQPEVQLSVLSCDETVTVWVRFQDDILA